MLRSIQFLLLLVLLSSRNSSALDLLELVNSENENSASEDAEIEKEVPQSKERYSLEFFWDLAEKQGGDLQISAAKVEKAEAQIDFAQSKAYPTGKVDLVIGPAPGASGDAVNGLTDWNIWGLVSGVRAELIQPIYTFGALSGAREAARAAARGERALFDRDRFLLREEIAKFYYSYQLAFELREVADGIVKKLDEALVEGERMRKSKKKGRPSTLDLDQLRVYLVEAKVRRSEAEKSLDQVRAAMAWKIGRYGTEVPRWDRANLRPVEKKLSSLKTYQKLATEMRPELKGLKAQVEARAAMVDVQTGLFLPTLYLGGQFTYTYNSHRSDQRSPFAYDPLNDLSGALLLGLRWNLGVFESRSHVAMATADSIKAQAELRHFQMAIHTEVEKEFLEARHLGGAVELREEASRVAKRVYLDSAVGFGLGTVQARKLIEAVAAYALADKARFEVIYNYNLQWVKMQKVTGSVSL